MRYSLRENTRPVAPFETGETVTIALYKLSDGSVITLTDNSCYEVGGSAFALGIYAWDISNIQTPPTEFTEYIWIMTDSNGNTRPGKLVLGGFPTCVEDSCFQDAAVWVDVNHGTSGTDWPLGTLLNPVDNFADALVIANANGITRFKVHGSITIGATDDVSDMTFEEAGEHATIVLTNGCTTVDTSFEGHIHISGYVNGHIHARRCHFYTDTYNLQGFFDRCLFDDGNYSINGSSLTRFVECISSGQQGQAVVLSCAGSGIDLGIWGWSGKMEIINKDGTETFDIEMLTGELEVASSCTDGVINARGIVEVTDNSGAGCNVVVGKLITEQIDAQLSGSHGSGTWEVDSINTDITFIKKIESGRWRIVNNQMIFYDDDNTTPILTVNLFDADGNPTETNPYERYPV